MRMGGSTKIRTLCTPGARPPSNLAEENVYRCPTGEKLTYRFTSQEHGLKLRRYCTNACRNCSLKSRCTPGRQRRITRWDRYQRHAKHRTPRAIPHDREPVWAWRGHCASFTSPIVGTQSKKTLG